MAVSIKFERNQIKNGRLANGVYTARLIQVIDLGTQTYENNGELRERHELLFVFEISKMRDDGRPFVISLRCTNNMHENGKLRQVLSSLMKNLTTVGECIDLGTLLDACCLVTVALEESVRSKNAYNKIVAVAPLPDDMCCIDRVNDLIEFGFDEIDDVATFERLFPWVQETIKTSKEYAALAASN